LKDGAAVLRAGKVVAAGCLLPLTENPDVAKSLGTRHRSGVGLTEETDAVAVIVSGGTGQVSVGVRGELMQGLSVEDLRGILTKLCAVSETEPASAA
jgi:diadenylate cyclase